MSDQPSFESSAKLTFKIPKMLRLMLAIIAYSSQINFPEISDEK